MTTGDNNNTDFLTSLTLKGYHPLSYIYGKAKQGELERIIVEN